MSRMTFKPNRDVLNVHFEGYKLAESSLSCIASKIDGGVKRVKLNEECFSYQHVRQTTMCNHLTFDPWNDYQVYWTSTTNQIMCGTIWSAGELVITAVYQDTRLPESDLYLSTNPSLIFVSPYTSVYHDPILKSGEIILLNTRNRTNIPTCKDLLHWELLTSINLGITEFSIKAVQLSEDRLSIYIVSTHLSSPLVNSSGNKPFCSLQLHQVIFVQSLDETSTSVAVDKMNMLFRTEFSTIPLYVELMGNNVLVVSESDLKLQQGPGVRTDEQRDGEEEEDSKHSYRGIGYGQEGYEWSQTDTDLSVCIDLPVDVTKRDISCLIEFDSLVVGLTDGTTFIRGELFGKIDPEASTWVIENNRLEVTLEKLRPGCEWIALLNDETSGSRSLPLREGLDLTAEEMIQLEERIAQVVASEDDDKREGKRESSNKDGDSLAKRSKPIFQNTLEDCDIGNDQDIKVILISMDGIVSQTVSLGGKELLFAKPPSATSSSLLCIKHDVDAIIYTPNLLATPNYSHNLQWSHINTFNALGYVQASKRDKKFLTCSHDTSYAALTDYNRHVFVYLQPNGGVKGHTALQYVHTLHLGTKDDTILGIHAGNEGFLFVLCQEELLLLRVITPCTVSGDR